MRSWRNRIRRARLPKIPLNFRWTSTFNSITQCQEIPNLDKFPTLHGMNCLKNRTNQDNRASQNPMLFLDSEIVSVAIFFYSIFSRRFSADFYIQTINMGLTLSHYLTNMSSKSSVLANTSVFLFSIFSIRIRPNSVKKNAYMWLRCRNTCRNVERAFVSNTKVS